VRQFAFALYLLVQICLLIMCLTVCLRRDIIKGLLSLHSKGFCCPKLTGKDIAILSEDGHLSAKIWNFSEAG